MDYTLHSPCSECPFLAKFQRGYSIKQLAGKTWPSVIEYAQHCGWER